MSPPTCSCKEAVGGHHGGCCCSGTMTDAQATRLFHPRSRCPEAEHHIQRCVLLPPQLCSAQRSVPGNGWTLQWKTAFVWVAVLWGDGSSLYLQSYHGMEHIHLNMRPQTCSTRFKEQAGTGLLTTPQTGLRLVLPLQGSSEGLWSMHVLLVCVWLSLPTLKEVSSSSWKSCPESLSKETLAGGTFSLVL